MEIDVGYYFWKRVDMVRPKNETLKQLAEDAQLNYHLVKVQRSCNRIPKALEAARLASTLNVSLEWLLTGTMGSIQNEESLFDPKQQHQVCRIFKVLLSSDQTKWKTVESVLGIHSQAD